LSTVLPGAGQWPGVTSSAARLPVASSAGAPELPPFDVLYAEHFDFVWRTARRLGLPEAAAEDCVQDTFIVLHRRLADYDGTTPLKRWILGMTVRVAADHRRRWKRKEAPCVPHASDSNGDLLLASASPTPSADLETAESLRLLDAILGELDEDKREVLVLSELEEMTAPEIAAVLGVNVNTIYGRLRAARSDFEAAYTRHRARTARRTP
jgi:RNA polymerase sigma-70 factor, ECF subfamily